MRNRSVRFKLLASITACTLLLGVGVYAYMSWAAADQAAREAAVEARRLSIAMEETRAYYSERVAGVCRKQGMDVTPDYAGKPNAIPLPATMVHELSDSLRSRFKTPRRSRCTPAFLGVFASKSPEKGF